MPLQRIVAFRAPRPTLYMQASTLLSLIRQSKLAKRPAGKNQNDLSESALVNPRAMAALMLRIQVRIHLLLQDCY